MRYAQINSNGVCIAVSDLSDEVTASHMILIGESEFPIGMTRTGTKWVTGPAAPVEYRAIDKVEAMGLIRTVTSMTPTQEIAFRDDPILALFWRIWREDVGSVINRDHLLTAQILGAIRQAGYLSTAQSQAVLDNWPTT